jgi:hypothetical protein
MNLLEGKETEYYGWKEKNTDGYGSACFRYAEHWADLMEKEIKKGNDISEIAESASHEADTEGITGFMYGMAVSILSLCWVHGEKLRLWHNKKYNHKGDGVVNPAILTIG